MSRRSVHQILVGAGPGDAITSMALRLRTALRASGPSEVYAHYLSPDTGHAVLPLHELGAGRPGDLLVYHASYGEPRVTQLLLSRREPIVLVYHNITPARFYLAHDPVFAAGLQWGRHELELIRDRTVLAVADSAFNAGDLTAQGYDDVHVIPAGIDPSHLTSVLPSGHLAAHLRERFAHGFVIGVSQLLPHKRFETTIEAMHLVQWVHERRLGLVIVGTPRSAQYDVALQQHARALQVRDVWFTGRQSDTQLATFLRMATLFVSASAHEGLALTPLEAMSFGLPVVARAAGALTDTLAGAAVVLPERSGPMLMSEAIVEVASSADLRDALRRRGHARVAELRTTDRSERFIDLIGQVA